MKQRIFIWSSAVLWGLILAVAYLSLDIGNGGIGQAMIWIAVAGAVAAIAVFTTRRAEGISQLDRIVGHVPAIVTVAMIGAGFGSAMLSLVTS